MAKPFLKWAGGKRQLIEDLRRRAPSSFRTYYEPFLGAGALFFALAPERAVISDINEELINVYEVVRSDVELLLEELARHVNDEEHFYRVRSWDREENYAQRSAAERAARFIYLNRTCFNGLYRVNSKGCFNVPFGRYVRPRIVDEENLRACSERLKRARILRCSFEELDKQIRPNDFVYLDPPYVPLSETSSFTSYYRGGFSQDDQERLRGFCRAIAERGAFFMLSNSATSYVREAYDGFRVESVLAARAVNADASKRGKIEELIVTNF